MNWLDIQNEMSVQDAKDYISQVGDVHRAELVAVLAILTNEIERLEMENRQFLNECEAARFLLANIFSHGDFSECMRLKREYEKWAYARLFVPHLQGSQNHTVEAIGTRRLDEMVERLT